MSPEAAARETIDELLVAAGWAIQDYRAFNPGAARGNTRFVFQQATATGTAPKTVPLAGLRMFAIPLPPLAEQKRIVAEVERRLSEVEELETVVNFNLQRATRLRQSILQQAFSGKLVQ